MSKYDYQELLERALKTGDDDDIGNLAEWFDIYGADYWNGEYYDASIPGEPSGYRKLYPIYDGKGNIWTGDEPNIIGWELF